MNKNYSATSAGTASFVCGLAAGAAAAILFAPRPGSATRAQIAGGVSNIKQRGSDVVGEGKKRVTAAIEAGRAAYQVGVNRS